MRRLLIRAGAALGVLITVAVGAGIWMWSSASQSNVENVEFENELQIPPLAEPTVDEPGHKVFDLELQQGTTELLPGEPAQTWGINGPHLGPTLRAERDDQVTVNVDNRLPETTTLHWHGMHLPAEADGGPHYRGLAGMFLLDDSDANAVALPSRYGVATAGFGTVSPPLRARSARGRRALREPSP